MDKRKEKQEIITAYLSGGISMRKLGVKYGYGHTTITRWVMAHKKYGKEQSSHHSRAVLVSGAAMPEDVKGLQEALRLSRLKVDLLEAMIDISDEQFGTNIRKKAGTSRS